MDMSLGPRPFTRISRFVPAALSLLVATGAAAHPNPCLWDVFTPTAFFEQIRQDLPVVAIATVPTQAPSLDVPSGASLLVKQGTIVGSIEWESNPRRGHAIMSVYDMSQVLLFQVSEKEALCDRLDAPGLCQSITIVSEQQPVVSDVPPFEITLGAGDLWPRFWRYGVELDYWDWHHELRDAYAWLGATLDTIQLGYAPRMDSVTDRLFWALASDPFVARYLGQVRLVVEEGRLAAYGVVPSYAAYNAIVSTAINAGFYGFRPHLIIDTRTAEPPLLAPTMATCER